MSNDRKLFSSMQGLDQGMDERSDQGAKPKVGGLTPQGAKEKDGGLTPQGAKEKDGGLTPQGAKKEVGGLTPQGAKEKVGGLTPQGAKENVGGLTPQGGNTAGDEEGPFLEPTYSPSSLPELGSSEKENEPQYSPASPEPKSGQNPSTEAGRKKLNFTESAEGLDFKHEETPSETGARLSGKAKKDERKIKTAGEQKADRGSKENGSYG